MTYHERPINTLGNKKKVDSNAHQQRKVDTIQ